jgi:hypothetical protein
MHYIIMEKAVVNCDHLKKLKYSPCLPCNILLDKRNPIGYSMEHDKIFYP